MEEHALKVIKQSQKARQVAPYTSYGLFKGLSNELNKLVAKKRHSSLVGVLVSFSIGGIVSYSLWKDDEFKELLIELRKS